MSGSNVYKKKPVHFSEHL